MKQLLIRMCTALFALFVFVLSPFIGLVAQTDFVKHAENPILPLGTAGEWDDTEAAYAHVLYDGSTYRMWYSGSPNQNTYRIGYATSSDGISWDKSGMALGTGTAGSFDDFDAWLPYVLFDGSQYEMWYTGNGEDGGIGYITTADPASWTRQRTTPVLTGDAGAWDQRAFGPVVLRSDSLYQMWYGGERNGIWQTGYAISPDGINWAKHPNNPVLTVGAGEWDATAALPGSVIYEDGRYHLWYHGTSGNAFTGWAIGYATSTDGVNWTKDALNPIVVPTPNGWDNDNVGFSRVIKDGKRYRIWYTGRGDATNGFDRLGYTEDFSALSHTESVDVDVSYSTPGAGDIRIDAAVVNPDANTLSATALILSSDGSVTDSTALTDAGGGIWHSSWPIPDGERSYSVGVRLRNMDTGYTNNGHDWNIVDRFTTIGPVVVAGIEKTDLPPAGLQLDVSLANNGLVAAAMDVTAEISTEDTSISFTVPRRHFGNIEPGQESSTPFFGVFTGDPPENTTFTVHIFSEEHFFWSDSFSISLVGVVQNDDQIPFDFALAQNYPNPFNPSTTIRYDIPIASPVRLEIFDLLGQRVKILINETKQPGSYTVIWNGRNALGEPAPSGVYLYRLHAGDFQQSRKLLLLK